MADLRRISAAAVCAMCAVSLALADGSSAQLPPFPPPGPTEPEPPPSGPPPAGAKVRVSTTGNDSEVRRKIPIARDPGKKTRVVMSMSPELIPDLEAGDLLYVSAELEVTTDCLNRDLRRQCAASPYRYNPLVGAQLVMATGRGSTTGIAPLSERQEITCRQKLPDREHHCMIVFSGTPLQIADPGALACPPGSCHINLVVDAHHRLAHGRDRLIVGADERLGRIKQDKGRINVIRVRDPDASEGPSLTSPPRASSSLTTEPLTRGLELGPPKRDVVYSERLEGLKEDEQLAVSASFRTGVIRLRHNTRISTTVILADSPTATSTEGFPEKVARLNGEITEGNGFNCTQRTTPCDTVKVGVLEMKDDAERRSGEQVTLYVNVVAGIHSKLGRSPGDNLVRVKEGFLTVIRYPPALRG